MFVPRGGRKMEGIMTCRAIPILALIALFVAAPVLACEAIARDVGSSAAPMDMAVGCTEDAGMDGPPVLCPASAMTTPTPHVELPRDLVAIAPSPLPSEAYRSGLTLPSRSRSTPRPPGAVPLYKIHAAYLI